MLRAFITCLIAAAAVAPVRADVSIDRLIEDAGLSEGAVASRDLPGWRPPRKLVVRDAGDFIEALRAEFPGVRFVAAPTPADAVAAAADADAIIGYCTEEVIAAAEKLVWVQIFSAGAEHCLEVDELASGEVLLTNMQKISSPVIGEHAVAMMLSLTRGLVQQAKTMPDGKCERSIGDEIRMISVDGKTLLVVGLGGIGTAAAKRAAALGMRVVATRNSTRSGPAFVDYVGLSGELLELAAEADVVINALPLTPETEGLFDKAFFDAVKPGVFFVNVARGASVVTDDLVAALADGRVAGAGLDVTDPEPLPAEHPLWRMPNVIITPHIAWYGNDRERQATLARENIRRFIAGEALLNVVDPAKGY
ncbi:MAG TPA: D-2-hydroxyacid dehydrogenase [Woeseiaceae bacterium]|nr:D-2-hydroxyacid dehydrogenase [Woeseiaceae bacterium]